MKLNSYKATSTLLSLLTALSLGTAALADHEPGHKVLVLKNRTGAALLGYDPVAYFTDGKPALGNPQIKSSHAGADYWFVSAAHKAMFDGAPEKYAPAYGGYCGYAASIDRLSPISPEWWQIVDGRLVLQHNKKAFDKFNAELRTNVVRADQNWPGLVARNGTGSRTLQSLDTRGVAIEGYDPVAYFKEGRPAPGRQEIEGTYNGGLYHFTTQENRETFERDPAKYVPAYGGYCGYAASVGKVRPANPLLWSVVDGQLILQHTRGAAELWEKDVAGNKSKADRFWPRLVEAKAAKKNPVDSLLGKSVLADAR